MIVLISEASRPHFIFYYHSHETKVLEEPGANLFVQLNSFADICSVNHLMGQLTPPSFKTDFVALM